MTAVKLGRSRVFFIPGNWKEVSKELILKISPYLMHDTPANRISLIKAMVPPALIPTFYLLNPEQVYQLTTLTEWMYDTYFYHPIISEFKDDKGNTFILPAEYLKRCVIVEFAYADKYYEAIAGGDSSRIDYLILSLCRPQRKHKGSDEDWDGDPREKFNPVLIEERVKYVRNLDIGFKLYFLLFFIGCKRRIAEMYPPLFRKREEDEEQIPPQKNVPDFGWVGVIWDLAGGVLNEEKVQYTNMHNIMAYLCKLHYDKKEKKDAIPQHI